MSKKLDNIVHHYLGNILTTNKDFRSGIRKLKNSSNFYAICKTSDKLLNISTAYHKHFFGNPLPQSIKELGVANKNYFADNLKNEIDWFLNSLRKYRGEISIFLNLKKDYEKYFLIGDYTKAIDLIEKSIKHLGYSNWAITSRFQVYEYNNSQDKAKMLLSEVLEKNKEGIFTSSLVHFLSQRSERKLSAHRFDSDLNVSLNNVRSNIDQANKDYYKFQLNFFENHKFTELKEVLCFDYCNSIIDRYLTFRRLIFYCLCNAIEVDYITEKIGYFPNKVSDSFFDNVRLISGFEVVDNDFYDSKYLGIIDLYYTGQYAEVCDEIKNNIFKYADNFTFINLYARSLVFQNRSFIPLLNNPCLINEISENLFKIYKRANNPSESLYNLYQISKNLDNFSLNYQLNSFIKNEQNIGYNPLYFYFSLPKADPLIFQVLTEKNDLSETVYNKIIQNTFISVSVNYKYNILKGDYEFNTGINKTKYLIDKAKYLFDKKVYEASLPIWQNVYLENQETPPLYEIAVDYIFRIHVEKLSFDNCLEWYINNYIKNPYTVYKINTTDIQKALRKGRYKNIVINIYLPIFISLVSSDENEKCFAIELYCKANDAKYPTDLLKNPLIKKDKYLEIFLFLSCNNETIKTYRHLNTTKKRLEERIEICNFLISNYQENNAIYLEELNLLTNELIIYEGTQKLDESKIYANDQAILNKELDEFEGLYNRFMTIAGLYLKNVKILTINKNELRYLNQKNNIEYSQNEIDYSEQAHFDAFQNIFSVILEKFLYSKFGIVTYLSTRIRHGVFLGELRPEFEKNNIIFFKDKLKDRYIPNNYWLSRLPLNSNQKEKLVSSISNFSNNIDLLISSIIKENIQIKFENEHPNGWFDYDFGNDDIADYAVDLYYEDGYRKFCEKALNILWKRTEENLELIRISLLNNIKPQFISTINEFESDLNRILGKDNMQEIFTSISNCSTNIQLKIDKISTWFKRSGKTHSDFKINFLVDIICKNVQKSYPNKSLQVNFQNDFCNSIKGEFYEHFNDFIRIFVDNMLKHSVNNIVVCNIFIRTFGDYFEMQFENDSGIMNYEIISENSDYGIQIDGIKLITEGKSGLVKAVKTVKDDLKNEDNEIYFLPTKNKFKVTVKIHYSELIV